MLKNSAIAIFTAFLLVGCTYQSHVNYGTQFTSSQVSQIKKNVTTTKKLLEIFGEPAMKSVLSENEEKWVYSHTGGTASAQAFTMKTKSDISTHMLDILVRDGIVINFAETNTNHNMNVNTNVK